MTCYSACMQPFIAPASVGFTKIGKTTAKLASHVSSLKTSCSFKANALAALPLLTTSFHTPEYPWSMWGSCKGVHVRIHVILNNVLFFYISSKIWNPHILIWYPTPFLAWASHLTFTSAPPPRLTSPTVQAACCGWQHRNSLQSSTNVTHRQMRSFWMT